MDGSKINPSYMRILAVWSFVKERPRAPVCEVSIDNALSKSGILPKL